MIEIEGLRKSFGPVPALHPLDASLRGGRVTAIVGPNGSGKSTLVRILLGLVRPDAGEIRLDGAKIARGPDYRSRVGFMPQEPTFPPNLRVRELVHLLDDLRRGTGAGEAAGDGIALWPDALATRLGTDAFQDRAVGTLSGGMKQRVSAALAFRYDPELLVLDEPTAGLDPIARAVLKERIREARDEGRTVLITSHILTELEDVADDVLLLVDGRMRFLGDVGELLRRTGARRLETAVVTLLRRTAGAGGRLPGGPGRRGPERLEAS